MRAWGSVSGDRVTLVLFRAYPARLSFASPLSLLLFSLSLSLSSFLLFSSSSLYFLIFFFVLRFLSFDISFSYGVVSIPSRRGETLTIFSRKYTSGDIFFAPREWRKDRKNSSYDKNLKAVSWGGICLFLKFKGIPAAARGQIVGAFFEHGMLGIETCILPRIP